jgi:hypothetical protein
MAKISFSGKTMPASAYVKVRQNRNEDSSYYSYYYMDRVILAGWKG